MDEEMFPEIEGDPPELPTPIEDAREIVRLGAVDSSLLLAARGYRCVKGLLELIDEQDAAMLKAPGKVGRGHPDTSRKASKNVQFGTQRAEVLLQLFSPRTADELAARLHGPSPNQVATRIGELREGGYVEYALDRNGDRMRRVTRRGQRALVHRRTSAGDRLATQLVEEHRRAG